MIDRWKDTLRRGWLYDAWRRRREQQQLSRFEMLASAPGPLAPFTEADLRSAVLARPPPRAGSRGVRHVIAFGTNDWEQHGLWQSLQRRGDFSLFDYQASRGSRPPSPSLRESLGRSFLAHHEARASSHGPVDLVFLYAAGFWIDPGMLRELRRRGTTTILLALDDKQQLAGPGFGGMEGWQREVAAEVDLYWTTWRGAVDALGAAGVHAWYAAPGADPEIFHPVDVAKDLDLLWIGRAYGPRVALVEVLRRAGLRVHAVGPGWPGGYVPFDSMIELVSRSRIVLGMGGVGHTDAYKHLKGRDFEIPMCGAAYLTSFNPELTDHFRIGEEILCYSSPQEAVDVATWALRRPGMLRAMGEAARSRCSSEHSWDQRISSALALLGLGA